ncbi:hypothetical protein F0365_07985 [Nonlabens sp. Ci31]|uniref:hypothetical protein n=1 Tax=Nonlabens sp. Ci31 TaxID=2608253 RepID=UPI00146367A8|nr:hypothetical protein [Nonlabens sp. Ci31]QJP34340.1 hypothetical protein F0365_07985 [Nonlabens sp. Ci31]
MIDTLRSCSGKSIDHQWRKTFDNILYTTNGILTQTLWEDQQDQDKHPEVTNQLSKISYCNVKKVLGASQTNMSTLERYYNASEKHVLRQINELEPQVIIFGGTYDILEPGLNIMHYKSVMENDLPWYYSQDQIILNARHPQSTSGTRQKYCDNIIKAVINWKNMNG